MKGLLHRLKKISWFEPLKNSALNQSYLSIDIFIGESFSQIMVCTLLSCAYGTPCKSIKRRRTTLKHSLSNNCLSLVLRRALVHFFDNRVLLDSLSFQHQFVVLLQEKCTFAIKTQKENTHKHNRQSGLFAHHNTVIGTSSLVITMILWSIFGINWQVSCSRSSSEARRVNLAVWCVLCVLCEVVSTVLARRRTGGPSSSLPSSIFTKLCLEKIDS